MLELAAGSEAERDLWVAGLTAVLDMEEDAVCVCVCPAVECWIVCLCIYV